MVAMDRRHRPARARTGFRPAIGCRDESASMKVAAGRGLVCHVCREHADPGVEKRSLTITNKCKILQIHRVVRLVSSRRPDSSNRQGNEMVVAESRRVPGSLSKSALAAEADSCGSSVSKAMAVLNTLATSADGVLGVTEIARRIGMPKSTTHRLLQILQDGGLAERDGRQYRLGSQIVELSSAALRTRYRELHEVALPVMDELYESVHETIHLGMLSEGKVVYLEKITAPGGSRIPSRVGGRVPWSCTSMGKAIMAFSPPELMDRGFSSPLERMTSHSVVLPRLLHTQLMEARERGVAFSLEESRLGLACVGAPILNRAGVAIAAISVAGPTTRFNPRNAVHPIKLAALKIRARGGAGFPVPSSLAG
ncbi:IclR family transcriptional regulator [Mycolicibacterium sp. P9-22]|nr:IclR family transcriptional regulator [Mycolicibacterium sp. P9-22]